MAASPVPTSDLNLTTEKTPTEAVVHCAGKITSSTTATLTSTVRPLFLETKKVTIDLTNVSYMDSSGLGAIVGLYVSSKRASVELRLINLNQRLKELFRLTRMAAIFEGHEDFLGVTPD